MADPFVAQLKSSLPLRIHKAGAEQRTAVRTTAEIHKLGGPFEGVSFAVHETSLGPCLAVTVQGKTGVALTAFIDPDHLGQAMGTINDSASRVVQLVSRPKSELKQ